MIQPLVYVFYVIDESGIAEVGNWFMSENFEYLILKPWIKGPSQPALWFSCSNCLPLRNNVGGGFVWRLKWVWLTNLPLGCGDEHGLGLVIFGQKHNIKCSFLNPFFLFFSFHPKTNPIFWKKIRIQIFYLIFEVVMMIELSHWK